MTELLRCSELLRKAEGSLREARRILKIYASEELHDNVRDVLLDLQDAQDELSEEIGEGNE